MRLTREERAVRLAAWRPAQAAVEELRREVARAETSVISLTSRHAAEREALREPLKRLRAEVNARLAAARDRQRAEREEARARLAVARAQFRAARQEARRLCP